MKLFIADFGWQGAVIVVAENLEEAKAKAKELGEDGPDRDYECALDEVDITKTRWAFVDE